MSFFERHGRVFPSVARALDGIWTEVLGPAVLT